MCCDRAVIYTEAYQRHENLPVVLKRAVALRETLSRMPIFIEPDEVIMGHPASRPRGAEAFPEVNMQFMDDLDHFETREYNRLKVAPEVKAALLAMRDYWRGRTLSDHIRAVRTPVGALAVESGLLSNSHEWSGFAHVAMDYRKLLERGVEGMRREIEERLEALDIADPQYPVRLPFYRAALEVLAGLLALAERYRRLALETAAGEPDPVRKAELERMAAILGRVPLKPAGSFREAIQSFWLLQLVPQIESNGFSITPGRFDQYMWPYLELDLASGAIAWEEAQELVDMLFLKLSEIMRVDGNIFAEINAGYASGQNIALGGVDREGRDATNPLSRLCLAANYHVRLHQPNLTVRLHQNSPREFLELVAQSVSGGNGMPQILNDELIIDSLVQRGIPLAEARDYIPVGCDEITAHGHWGRCNGGYLNFAKVLEVTLGGGKDLRYGKRTGLDLDVDSSLTFGEFLDAFDRQMAHGVHLQACEANLTDHLHREIMPLPFVSVFLDDCLAKGRDVTDGGGHYNTTGLVGVGSATVADSLVAIRNLVFEKRKLSLREFREILLRDFAGSEPLRQFILNRLPKFGNDQDEADQLAVHVTGRFFDEVEKYRNYREGDFWPALYSVSAQIGLGNHVAATPDGRLAGQPLSDGLTPMYGLDVNGPTAALKSVAKVDQGRAPNGVIINQRLTRDLLLSPEGRDKFAQLLRCFVELRSFHWQFNVVDNETLRLAQLHPDDYRGLVVRVAGYSAIFVELSRKAQDSIIERCAASLA
jgi:formate C-acetyltransferase